MQQSWFAQSPLRDYFAAIAKSRSSENSMPEQLGSPQTA